MATRAATSRIAAAKAAVDSAVVDLAVAVRRRRLWRRRPIPLGGGLFKGGFGLIAIVVIGLILGVNPLTLLGGLASGGGGSYVAPQSQTAHRVAPDGQRRSRDRSSSRAC